MKQFRYLTLFRYVMALSSTELVAVGSISEAGDNPRSRIVNYRLMPG